MRKIFLLIFYFLLYLLVSFAPIQAVDIPNDQVTGPFDMVLHQCGYVDQQCCILKDYQQDEIAIHNIFSLPVPLNAATTPVETVINLTVNNVFIPVVNKTQAILKDTFNLTEYNCFEGRVSGKDNSCVCVKEETLGLANLCSNLRSAEKSECLNCVNNEDGVWTGIGCLTTDFSAFIKDKVFGIGLGLAGAVSLLCIIYSAFMLQTSQGSPEKIKKAQELLTNCIIGLILIIFSVFILRLIGVTILKIPGFT